MIMVVQYFHLIILIHNVKLISNYIGNTKEYYKCIKMKICMTNNKIGLI